jgi:predicted dehydrogenase
MRFFQPHDYVAVDYTTRRASVSSLAPPGNASARPGVHVRYPEVEDVEPLRAEIEAFLEAVVKGSPSPVSGAEGRRALALALRALEKMREHVENAGLAALGRP